MQLNGLITCARYAFMPNKLNYCGPNKNRDLFQYGVLKIQDKGLIEILEEFETMMPYLTFIAQKNNISDPFDARIVEAYWLGNELLTNVTKSKFFNHLYFERDFRKKIKRQNWNKLEKKISFYAKPHHSFHVLNVFRRTGKVAINHTLNTMDQCRISWGKVLKIDNDFLLVEQEPLVFVDNKLLLGPPIKKKVLRFFDGKGFVVNPRPGDWISIHWNWACEVITPRQKNNLEYWTKYHLQLFDGE